MERSDVMSVRRDIIGGLDSEDFRQQVYSQFKQTGVLGSVKASDHHTCDHPVCADFSSHASFVVLTANGCWGYTAYLRCHQ